MPRSLLLLFVRAAPLILVASAARAGIAPVVLPGPPGSPFFSLNRAVDQSGNRVLAYHQGTTGTYGLVYHVGASCPPPIALAGVGTAILGNQVVGFGEASISPQTVVNGAALWDLTLPASCPPIPLGKLPTGVPQYSFANGLSSQWIVGDSQASSNGFSGNLKEYGAGAGLYWNVADPSTELVLLPPSSSMTTLVLVGVDGNLAVGTATDGTSAVPLVWDLSNPSSPPISLASAQSASNVHVVGISGQRVLGVYGGNRGFWDLGNGRAFTTIPNAQKVLAIQGTKIVGSVVSPRSAAVWDTSDLSNPIILDNLPSWSYSEAYGISGNLVSGIAFAGTTFVTAVWDLANSGSYCLSSGPVADAGMNQAAADPISGTVLDGRSSTGVIVSYSWSEGCTIVATGANPSVVLASGLHHLMLTVTDNDGAQAVSTVDITVSDVAVNHCPAGITVPVTALAYAPAQGSNGTMLFEDLWPSIGDDDFNDQAIAYNYEIALDSHGDVAAIKATYNFLAAGASIRNGAYLHLPGVASNAASSITRAINGGATATLAPIAGESDLVVAIATDTKALFGPGNGFVNTDPTLRTSSAPAVSILITFATPVALSPGLAPFDLFIARTGNFGWQIHRPEYAGTAAMTTALFNHQDDASKPGEHFITAGGIPFALTTPDLVVWPVEKAPIDTLYPQLVTFGATGGTSDKFWYQAPQPGQGFTGGAQGTLPPTPVLFGNDLAVCSP